MKLIFEERKLRVIREPKDPKYYGIKNAKGESLLLYAILQKMRSMGYDVIKKRMWKDGHLVDEMQQYIRMRDCSRCWFNNNWAIRGLDEYFNEFGEAVLLSADLR